jgi:hypothetical protein
MHPLLDLAAAVLRYRGQTAVDRAQRVVAFDLPSVGELQFVAPVLTLYARRFPADRLLIVHGDTRPADFAHQLPALADRVVHVSRPALHSGLLGRVDLFVTSEQYSPDLDGIYSVCLFHGQPSKGLTFTRDILHRFDAFFLYGPLHHLALTRYLSRAGTSLPATLELFDVGYPKSDEVLSGKHRREEVLAELGLAPAWHTVVYAPAFNEDASLRVDGARIIEALARLPRCNVVVKLPIDCDQPLTNLYATGGIDWRGEVRRLADQHRNVRLQQAANINPLIACADAAVTCVSSVSFEFLVAGTPVVFYDTPAFFSRYLKRLFPEQDTVSWADDTTVNAGREFGTVVHTIPELTAAVTRALRDPAARPAVGAVRRQVLFNPGAATEAAVATLDALLRRRARTHRPLQARSLLSRGARLLAGAALAGVDRVLQRRTAVTRPTAAGPCATGSAGALHTRSRRRPRR